MIGHVVIDALFLDPGVSGGPETYARGLVPALARAAPDLRLTVISSRRGASSLRADGWAEFAAVEALPSDDDERVRKLVAQQVLLGRRARAVGADLVHSLSNLAPVRPAVTQVTTIYDVIYLRGGAQASMGWVSRASIGGVVRLGAPHAAAVITLTEAARADIVAALRVDPARVAVIPPGTGREPVAAADPRRVRAEYGLPPGRLLLCVGAKRPHKNQGLLIRALAQLPSDVSLVCAGRDDGDGPRLAALAGELGLRERVALLGYVPDADLEGLWKLASAAALPSRAEGFGLPLLEAMRRGVPVAAADIPVLREVGGDAVVWFPPDDPGRAAAALERALQGGGTLAAAAAAQAARFTWEVAAAATLEVYERAVR